MGLKSIYHKYTMEIEMKVVKRNGDMMPMAFDKILNRIKKLGKNIEPQLTINYSQLAIRVIDQLYDGISTSKIDELTAQECASQSILSPDMGLLAGRVVISNNHKNTIESLLQITSQLHEKGLLDPIYVNNIITYAETYQAMLDFSLDYEIDFFGFKTLERAYLLKIDGIVVERPQHMWMRVAIAIHGDNMGAVLETYQYMSKKMFTHATPTLFNAGMKRQQLSSCFLIALQEDSIEGIYETIGDCAKISKWAGGIGLHIHNVRATGSYIKGTNGTSNGIVPMLKVFNETARYVDQGGGKRNRTFSIYLSPDHADIETWLDLKKNTGDENARARDLFYGLWVPDLFMERVKADGIWSLFCPSECPGLHEVYGDEYKKLYLQYEDRKQYKKQISARELWFKILDAQMETGNPSILYKDACNQKSNQKNLGTIKSSNLCTEIVEYSSSTETAVCNLASISLAKCVKDKVFDYTLLYNITQTLVRNLDRIIDLNYYPTEKTMRSNVKHRPLGIGVQGLADCFILMDIPFHSKEALEVNRLIFETMYYAGVEQSMKLSRDRISGMTTLIRQLDSSHRQQIKSHEFYQPSLCLPEELNTIYHQLRPIPQEFDSFHLGAYSSFDYSPMSKGVFQFDMWNAIPSDRYNWDTLRRDVMMYGVRNSLLMAPMPTASTSQILGNNECFEPLTSNVYSRRTLAGEFLIVNHYLVRELMNLGLWDEDMKNNILLNKGSIQHIDFIPEYIRRKYKIVWEIPMKHLIDMARDRGAFICQSQSLNLWVEEPTYKILTSMHFYAWEQGLKTGIYYLRRKPRHQVQQFTIEPQKECETCSS